MKEVKRYEIKREQSAYVEADSQIEAEKMADMLDDGDWCEDAAYVTTLCPLIEPKPDEHAAWKAQYKLQCFTKLLMSGKVDSPHAESELENIMEAATSNKPYEPRYAEWFMYWGAWSAGWEAEGETGNEFGPMPQEFGGIH